MKFLKTSIDDVLIIEPDVFDDKRGFFMETYQKQRYEENGITPAFVQDNISYSLSGTLRGLHYQLPNQQSKLVQVINGEIFDVAVDIRRGAPTFGKWTGAYLSGENKHQLFIPEGFAHGFCVISKEATFMYKCSDFYCRKNEKGLSWSDPELNIKWPVKEPVLSGKDEKYPCLKDIPEEHLPIYTA